MTRPPSARRHASAARLARVGLALAGLGLGAGACLDRPVAPAAPRTSNAITEQVAVERINKIDLLFMVDNSISMADKQTILAQAVPDLLGRLITPNCVRADGQSVAPTGGACPSGTTPEFDPVGDIHIGVISSSLGGHGGNLCTPADPGNPNDNGRLLTRGTAEGGMAIPSVPTYRGLGFLAWDQAGVAGGERDAVALQTNFANIVRGVGQAGCGFEASLEAWYRFLVDPSPPKLFVPPPDPNNPGASLSTQPVFTEVDTALLEERANFLRPDSLVAVIALSDENDCSFIETYYPPQVRGDNGLIEQGGWPESYLRRLLVNTPNGGQRFFEESHLMVDRSENRFEQGTAACNDNPFSPECYSCLYLPDAGATPEETTALQAARTAVGCPATKAEAVVADKLNLRCFEQRRRFGFEALHPVQRYIDGLTQRKVYDTSGALIALNKPAPGPDDAKYFADDNAGNRVRDNLVAPKVDNPLFVDLPWRRYLATCADPADQSTCDASKRPEGRTTELRGRPDGRIYFAGIVGVPWQDIAVNPNTLAANAEGPGGFKDPAAIDWDLILGNPLTQTPPRDPLMRESIDDRIASLANKNHPVTGEDLSAGWNRINGHEWNSTLRDDLQYACIFPLGTSAEVDLQCDDPGNLEDPNDNINGPDGCDCDYDSANLAQTDPALRRNPLCETYTDGQTKVGTGTFTTKQARAKAYPGLRFLEVLRGIGDSAIVASICPETQDQAQPHFGYRPAVNTIIDRLKNALKGRCLPRRLDVRNNQSPCLVIEAKFRRNDDGTQSGGPAEISACQACSAPGYAPLQPELLASLQGQEVTNYDCLCEFRQLEGADQQTCQTNPSDPSLIPNINGWCYVDPAFAPDQATRDAQSEIVKNCPADAQRTLRFIGTQGAVGNSTEQTSIFITCLGAASNSPISSGAAGAGGAVTASN